MFRASPDVVTAGNLPGTKAVTGGAYAPGSAHVGALVFSKDRPLQLDGTLRSLRLHLGDVRPRPIVVLYVATTAFQAALYRQLAREHPDVQLVREGNFGEDVRRVVDRWEHVLFLVDDTIFIGSLDVDRAAAALSSRADLIGFSLRLGTNTTYCYPFDRPQSLPEFTRLNDDVLAYPWAQADGDFGYPLEVSSSVYRGEMVRSLLSGFAFSNPNGLEAGLAAAAGGLAERHPTLACLEQSVAFSVPVNVVQTAQRANRAADKDRESVSALARAFDRGDRMDVAAYAGLVPRGCHQEVPIRTVRRVDIATVSVVMPCYAQASFLADAVDSVVGQTWLDWELIIVDDGSPDDTAAVADRLIEVHSGRRIRLIRQQNRGVAEARNAGIRAAWGRYILPLDADDQLMPAMLEQTVGLLEARPDAAIAYTDVQEFGQRDRLVRAAEFDFDRLLSVNQLSHCALFRREVWEAVGGYDPGMQGGYEDWAFWISAGGLGYAACRIPEALFRYRVKETSRDTVARESDAPLRRLIRQRNPRLFTLRARLLRRARLECRALMGRAR